MDPHQLSAHVSGKYQVIPTSMHRPEQANASLQLPVFQSNIHPFLVSPEHLSAGMHGHPSNLNRMNALSSSSWIPPDTPHNRLIMNQVSALIANLQDGGSSISAQTSGLEQSVSGRANLIGVQGPIPGISPIHTSAHDERMCFIAPQVTPQRCHIATQQKETVAQGSKVRHKHNGNVQNRPNYFLSNEPRNPISDSRLAEPLRNVEEQDSSHSFSSEQLNDTSSFISDINNEVMDTSSLMSPETHGVVKDPITERFSQQPLNEVVAGEPSPQEKETGTAPETLSRSTSSSSIIYMGTVQSTVKESSIIVKEEIIDSNEESILAINSSTVSNESNNQQSESVSTKDTDHKIIFQEVLNRLKKEDYPSFHELLLKFYACNDERLANEIKNEISLLPLKKTPEVDPTQHLDKSSVNTPHRPQQYAAPAGEILVTPQEEVKAQSEKPARKDAPPALQKASIAQDEGHHHTRPPSLSYEGRSDQQTASSSHHYTQEDVDDANLLLSFKDTGRNFQQESQVSLDSDHSRDLRSSSDSPASVRDSKTASSSSGQSKDQPRLPITPAPVPENFQDHVYQRNLYREAQASGQVPPEPLHPFIRPADPSKTQSMAEIVQRQREVEEVTFKKPWTKPRKENSRKRDTSPIEKTTSAKKAKKTVGQAQLDQSDQNRFDFDNHPIPRAAVGVPDNQNVGWIPLFANNPRRNDFPCPRDIVVFMNPFDPYQRTYFVPDFSGPVFVNHREPNWRMHFDPTNPAHRTKEYDRRLEIRRQRSLANRSNPPQQMPNSHQTQHVHQPQMQVANNQHQMFQNTRHNSNQNVQNMRLQQHPKNRPIGPHDLQNLKNPHHPMHRQTGLSSQQSMQELRNLQQLSHMHPQLIQNLNHYPDLMQNQMHHQNPMHERSMNPQKAMQQPNNPYQTVPNSKNPENFMLSRNDSEQQMLNSMNQNPRFLQIPMQNVFNRHLPTNEIHAHMQSSIITQNPTSIPTNQPQPGFQSPNFQHTLTCSTQQMIANPDIVSSQAILNGDNRAYLSPEVLQKLQNLDPSAIEILQNLLDCASNLPKVPNQVSTNNAVMTKEAAETNQTTENPDDADKMEVTNKSRDHDQGYSKPLPKRENKTNQDVHSNGVPEEETRKKIECDVNRIRNPHASTDSGSLRTFEKIDSSPVKQVNDMHVMVSPEQKTPKRDGKESRSKEEQSGQVSPLQDSKESPAPVKSIDDQNEKQTDDSTKSRKSVDVTTEEEEEIDPRFSQKIVRPKYNSTIAEARRTEETKKEVEDKTEEETFAPISFRSSILYDDDDDDEDIPKKMTDHEQLWHNIELPKKFSWSQKQKSTLREEFAKNNNPDQKEMEDIAITLNVERSFVEQYFKNKKMRK